MTWEERVAALTAKGFSQRQAGFLVTVMLHAGVCLGRQYCAFSQTTYGKDMHTFFQRLLAAGLATARPCGHARARLHHIHAKSLYRAIGDADNRHRRSMSLPRAIEKLMLLDAVLADRTMHWLGTERDKVAHFTLKCSVPPANLPALRWPAAQGDGPTARYFAEKLPVGVGADGRSQVFLYLPTSADPLDFRGFLQRHAELFRGLSEWTVRLVIPRHLTGGVNAHRDAFLEQLAMPLRPNVRDELHWYFQARRSAEDRAGPRFARARRAFGTARFQTLYWSWLDHGDSVLDATLSPVLADAIERGTGSLECQELSHRYLHLFPLVGTA